MSDTVPGSPLPADVRARIVRVIQFGCEKKYQAVSVDLMDLMELMQAVPSAPAENSGEITG